MCKGTQLFFIATVNSSVQWLHNSSLSSATTSVHSTILTLHRLSQLFWTAISCCAIASITQSYCCIASVLSIILPLHQFTQPTILRYIRSFNYSVIASIHWNILRHIRSSNYSVIASIHWNILRHISTLNYFVIASIHSTILRYIRSFNYSVIASIHWNILRYIGTLNYFVIASMHQCINALNYCALHPFIQLFCHCINSLNYSALHLSIRLFWITSNTLTHLSTNNKNLILDKPCITSR
jgi:hypothetical protein